MYTETRTAVHTIKNDSVEKRYTHYIAAAIHR